MTEWGPALSKPDYFSLPVITETINRLSGSSLFSVLDFAMGSFQIPLYLAVSAPPPPAGVVHLLPSRHGRDGARTCFYCLSLTPRIRKGLEGRMAHR